MWCIFTNTLLFLIDNRINFLSVLVNNRMRFLIFEDQNGQCHAPGVEYRYRILLDEPVVDDPLD